MRQMIAATSVANPTKGKRIHPMMGMIPNTTSAAIAAILRKMHWKAWKRTYLLLLYGSITRKIIAGMIVMYASIPAVLSGIPPEEGAGVGDDATVLPPKLSFEYPLRSKRILPERQVRHIAARPLKYPSRRKRSGCAIARTLPKLPAQSKAKINLIRLRAADEPTRECDNVGAHVRFRHRSRRHS